MVLTWRINTYYAVYKIFKSFFNEPLVKSHSLKSIESFPRNTAEEKRLFKLLHQAYVQARYNPDFVVTKEDIAALIPKVKMLRGYYQTCMRERNNEI
jgi:hypothetical protein